MLNLVVAPMPKAAKPTALIVGSGPGSLASALLLAHSGVNVTVLEKEPQVGGRTKLIHKDGFTFDRGPTFFLPRGHRRNLSSYRQRCPQRTRTHAT